jgi:hypothetical protein
LRGGLENKARRGELRLNLPVGLERDEDGRIRLASDEQVRGAIEHVYATWRRCASTRQVVSELAGDGRLLPRRTVGERRIRWEPASFGACTTCSPTQPSPVRSPSAEAANAGRSMPTPS